jgi:DNA-binding PadR family transcriptional regulator
LNGELEMGSKGFLGEFEQMVLLAIIQQSDQAFALEVRREIEESANRPVSRGAFYTTLDRLERKGLLEWREETPADARRKAPLRLYRVTPAGLGALRDSRRALDSLSRGLDALLERTP